MSIKIMSIIWERGPDVQSERFVLLALADYANDEGECWPSIAGIAAKTCLTTRGVQKVIRRLQDAGWLEIVEGGGRKNCHLFRIKTLNVVHPEHGSPLNVVPKKGERGSINPEHGSPEPSLTIKEPSVRTPLPHKPDLFDEFWSTVPRKVGKGSAQKAWAKAIKSADPKSIIDGMRRYAFEREGKDPQYTAHPASWLNAQRWTDEAPASQQDFHNMISQALEVPNAISGPRETDHGQTQRIPAALQATGTPGPERGADRTAGNGGGNELAYSHVIRPKRFGGADY